MLKVSTEHFAHFTADHFSETITGIKELAASGNPRAEAIIRALQDGRLMYSAEKKAVYEERYRQAD